MMWGKSTVGSPMLQVNLKSQIEKWKISTITAGVPRHKTSVAMFLAVVRNAGEGGDTPRSPISTAGRTGDGVCDERTTEALLLDDISIREIK
jgi:hypothetical protein